MVWPHPIGGLSSRLSGYYWDALCIAVQLPVPNPTPDQLILCSCQNVGRIVTEGIEVEASYRNSGGWYAFGGGAYSRVGSSDTGGTLSYDVVNAPAVTAAGGLSTPKLFGLAQLSTEPTLIAVLQTRRPMDGTPSPG